MGVGYAPLYVLIPVFSGLPLSSREHGKAINMDCGLAVVSTRESYCPQEAPGTDDLLHEFPEMAELFLHEFWRGSQRSGEGQAVGMKIGLLLSSFLAKV